MLWLIHFLIYIFEYRSGSISRCPTYSVNVRVRHAGVLDTDPLHVLFCVSCDKSTYILLNTRTQKKLFRFFLIRTELLQDRLCQVLEMQLIYHKVKNTFDIWYDMTFDFSVMKKPSSARLKTSFRSLGFWEKMLIPKPLLQDFWEKIFFFKKTFWFLDKKKKDKW